MKIKVNVTMDKDAWRAFRIECLKRNLTASGELGAFVRARLSEWEQKEKKGGKERRG